MFRNRDTGFNKKIYRQVDLISGKVDFIAKAEYQLSQLRDFTE